MTNTTTVNQSRGRPVSRVAASPLLLLGLLGFLLGLGLFPVLDFEGLPPIAVTVVVALPVMFWMYLAAGLVAWWRRPGSGVGVLLVWAGVCVWVIGMSNTTVPAFQVVGAVFTSTLTAALVHLLLAYPTGQLGSRFEVRVVTAAYVVAIVLQTPRYLLDPPTDSPGWALGGVVGSVQLVGAFAVSAVAAGVLVVRLGRARPEHRRTLGLVYGYGVFVVLFVPLLAVVYSAWWPEQGFVRDSIQIISVALVPVIVVTTFLFGGFRPTSELEVLGAWLVESEGSRAPIATALAEALGDPTLTVAYWSGELAAWVRADGLIATARDGVAGRDRARYELGLGGVPVAVVEYDAGVLRDPYEVERAAGLVALALERERLSAELRASRQAVVESRERLVGAADAERRRISRSLHDGLQARLLLLGIDAGRIATAPAADVAARATALRDDVDLAAAELRAMVEDLVPPALIELGLVGAVAELIESMPVAARFDPMLVGRVDGTVATTAYLIVAEALSNVVKHANATACTVTLRAVGAWLHVEVTDNGSGGADPSGGTGLAGIADRVAASGGTGGVRTSAEGGTLIWARIPFGS